METNNKNLENGLNDDNGINQRNLYQVKHISNMYESWFLDYASYVILERAVPYINDGLKPVQRRILHAMKQLEDGRYNKVANIIGFTMQYHPHGDASIGEALVALGQKDLLIDTQGNWGNIHTGDKAAAPRYIEARLTKFALEVLFNPKTTKWKLSYDGRNKEPVHLPAKFPLLLYQGVEGIAVGLASKILPHNFIELIDASIAHLNKKPFTLFPDFPTGGMVDCSKYNEGISGGKIRVRAKITKLDKKTLVINEIPYGRTTSSIIDSIISASEKGKIKIKKIDDNTADKVEILLHLPAGVSSDQTIDGLYAVTDCELSISPNSCVIEDHKPRFLGVNELLKRSVENTVSLLNLELLLKKGELEDSWHQSSLEKIFIENRIYNHIEECETWESIIETIDKGLEPFKKLLKREVTYDDIVRLTEIKIKRISRYNAYKADEYIRSLEEELEKTLHHLAHLTEYAINYYQRIKEKYAPGRERKTEIRNFDTIEATKVVAANQKLYANLKEGFVGTSLRQEEFITECSDIDDVIVFLKDGTFRISRVSTKAFFGKDIVHVGIFKKNDQRTIYNVVYQDGRDGNIMVKRFFVTGITRDKEYNLTKGTDNSRVIYFTANPNGEAETVRVIHKPKKRLRNIQFDFDFSTLAIKGRNSMGNILTKNAIYKISLKETGISTLGGRKIWFDPDVARLNADERGKFLGEFSGDEKILSISSSGLYKLYPYDLSTHFEPEVTVIEKFDPDKIFSVVFYDGEQQFYYLKRFTLEPTEKLSSLIGEHPDSRLILITDDHYPRLKIKFGGKHAKREGEVVEVDEFIGVKSSRARGKRLTTFTVDTITRLEPRIPNLVPDKKEPGSREDKPPSQPPDKSASGQSPPEEDPYAEPKPDRTPTQKTLFDPENI